MDIIRSVSVALPQCSVGSVGDSEIDRPHLKAIGDGYGRLYLLNQSRQRTLCRSGLLPDSLMQRLSGLESRPTYLEGTSKVSKGAGEMKLLFLNAHEFLHWLEDLETI